LQDFGATSSINDDRGFLFDSVSWLSDIICF
jgi:hypothetical protein